MLISFSKYHGTGNDFIVIDDRKNTFPVHDNKVIHFLCERRFAIGADGLMLLQHSDNYHFKMKYFNANGREGTMCGNGGRCIVAFAKQLGIIQHKTIFEAIDGIHQAAIDSDGLVHVKMNDVSRIERNDNGFFLDTGSPHYVLQVNDLNNINVFEEGRKIRYNERFKATGTNVNFIEIQKNNELFVRTYERGVENETYSCGTGVIASAITTAVLDNTDKYAVGIRTKGGSLKVSFQKKTNGSFTDIWLAGPATYVFKGEIEM